METAQMATAPAPATIRTAWRSGSRRDTVARVKRSNPASRTKPTGRIALSCQLTRTELRWNSSAVSWARGAAPAAAFVGSEFTGADCRRLSIGVHPGEQVSYAEEGEHHHGESQDGEVGSAPASPSARDAHVEVAGVYQPGNRGPGFFRIPAPVGAPGA